jgi:hypothetical protein
MGHGGLGQAVDRLSRQGHEAGLGAQVDDPAEALADHHPPGGLAGEEEALDVHVEGQVEVLLGHLLGRGARAEPRVVDQDVEAPEPAHDIGDRGLDLVEPADVHADGQRPLPHRLDLVDQTGPIGRLAQAEGHVSTGVGQSQGDRPADPARRPRHQRDPSIEIEAWKLDHRISSTVATGAVAAPGG